MAKERKEYKETTSRYVYNRRRKYVLEADRKIHCACCKYHDNENYSGKHYFIDTEVGEEDSRYPSWKLVSKNKKQWMSKKYILKKMVHRYYGNTYFTILILESER
jgi:hypothetical protein